MQKGSREELIIRLIHRNLLFLVLLIVVVVVILNLNRRGLLGPIKGGRENGFTLIWRISDHTATDAPLVNQLSGTTDEPKYEGDSVIKLTLRGDGGLEALPRLQGQLEYHLNSNSNP